MRLELALDIGPSGIGAGFDGKFSALLANVVNAAFTHTGLTYGTTPLALGTTVTSVQTLSGSLAATQPPVPIWSSVAVAGAIGSGASFNISYDGGVTTAQVITPAVSTPIALTGAAQGLSLAWGAGSVSSDATYKATCAGLIDTVSATHWTQATALAQPVITPGLFGHAGLAFNVYGSTVQFLASSLNLPAPGTTPTYMALFGRQINWTANAEMISCQNFAHAHQIIQATGSPGLAATSGTPTATTNALALNQFAVIEAYWANSSVLDYIRAGTDTDHTGTAAGNTASTGRWIGKGESGQAIKEEIFGVIHCSAAQSAAARAALRAKASQFYGPGIAV